MAPLLVMQTAEPEPGHPQRAVCWITLNCYLDRVAPQDQAKFEQTQARRAMLSGYAGRQQHLCKAGN